MININEFKVTSFENQLVPYDSENPNGLGLKVKQYTLIENTKSDEYKKCVEFENGTAVMQSVKDDFSKTKVRTKDGKWHLLQYQNALFEYNNIELLREREFPQHSVILGENDIPELYRYISSPKRFKKCEILYDFFSNFPKKTANMVENAFQLKGLSVNEANNLRQIFSENLSKVATDLIEKGQELIKRGSSLSETIAKLHIR